MINEDYCSFEIAEMLKEKGFNEYTNMVYKNELVKAYKEGKIGTQTRVKNFYRQKESDILFTLCPTHQMAMKWLREKHNIIITPQPEYFSCDRCESWGIDIWAFDNYEKLPGDFRTYEEAVDAALKYSLENLI